MTISASKFASYAVLSSDHGGNTVSASKTLSYAVLSSDYGLNTVTTSKLHAYAILSYDYGLDTASVAKFHAYAVLTPMGVDTSKLVGYAVLSPRIRERVTKLNSYAVLTNPINASKINAYAVLTIRLRARASKITSYAVLEENTLGASKLVGYAILNSYDDSGVDDPAQPPTHAISVTPSDSEALPHVTKAIYIGSTGDIQVTTFAYEIVIFQDLPVGWLYIQVRQIWATNTSAQEIVAAW